MALLPVALPLLQEDPFQGRLVGLKCGTAGRIWHTHERRRREGVSAQICGVVLHVAALPAYHDSPHYTSSWLQPFWQDCAMVRCTGALGMLDLQRQLPLLPYRSGREYHRHCAEADLPEGEENPTLTSLCGGPHGPVHCSIASPPVVGHSSIADIDFAIPGLAVQILCPP